MKVLLIQPPHAGREPSLFPLGLGYIARALQDIGCEVTVFDIHAHNYTREEVAEKIGRLSYDVTGISAFSTQYAYVKWLTAELKKSHQGKIIMGGPLPTYNPAMVLEKTLADICVISEGDLTVKSLIENIDKPEKVAGIYYRQNGRIISNPPRDYVKDLDSIPFPPYDIFPMDIYFRHTGLFGMLTRKTINIVTSRGCPYRCNFCSRTFGGVRLRSIDNVIAEIRHLKERFGVDSVYFNDELLVVSKNRAQELCDKIKSLGILWGCQGRSNIVDLELLKWMKSAGCVSVGYGVESGSQKILDNMNKHATVVENEKAITNTLKAGLMPVVQMIYGYPGEDKNTIRETVDFFNRVHYSPPTPDGKANLNLIAPLPGSPLYEESLQNGLIRDEDAYLSVIEMGYNPGSPVMVNFTEFSNAELLDLKARTEREIYLNYRRYLKRHPWKYFRTLFKQWQYLTGYRRRYGNQATLKLITRKLLRAKALPAGDSGK
jgi:anaerobic magnesium-protoporphyrin IX monomethyl ester cyclase